MAKLKIPKELGACIDMKFKLRASRHALVAQINEVKKQENAIEEYLFSKFEKSKLSGARGKAASASIEQKDVPTIKDDKKFYKYVQKTGAFDLFQRRLSSTAFNERWEKGVEIPGIEKFRVTKLSVTKIGKSKK
jgi:hypothetical protein